MDRQTCGSSAHGGTASLWQILDIIGKSVCNCMYSCRIKMQGSARKSDLMDASNPPQADVDMNTAINVD